MPFLVLICLKLLVSKKWFFAVALCFFVRRLCPDFPIHHHESLDGY
jgi:hypothetical protein